jgi:hypothetical protein
MNQDNFIPVANSSNVVSVLFDEPQAALYVTYKGNNLYRYDNVPVQDGRIIEATAQVDKVSTGQLVNRFIKQPKLKYVKL